MIVTRCWPATIERILVERSDALLNNGDGPLIPTQLKAAFLNLDAILPAVSDKLPSSVFPPERLLAKPIASFDVGLGGQRGMHLRTQHARGVDRLYGRRCHEPATRRPWRTREGERQPRAGKWAGWCPTHMIVTRVFGRTLGMVRIGKVVVKRAHFGFDMKILFSTVRGSMTIRSARWKQTYCHHRRRIDQIGLRVAALAQ
jgi:hypothetical protein